MYREDFTENEKLMVEVGWRENTGADEQRYTKSEKGK